MPQLKQLRFANEKSNKKASKRIGELGEKREWKGVRCGTRVCAENESGIENQGTALSGSQLSSGRHILSFIPFQSQLSGIHPTLPIHSISCPICSFRKSHLSPYFIKNVYVYFLSTLIIITFSFSITHLLNFSLLLT